MQRKELRISETDELMTAVHEDPNAIEPLFEIFMVKSIKEGPSNTKDLFDALTSSTKKWEGLSPLFRGIHVTVLALLEYYKGNANQVHVYVEEALRIFEEYRNKDYLGMAYLLSGGNYRTLGKIDTSVDYLYRSIDLINPNGPCAPYLTYSNYQLAEIFSYIEDYDAAKEAYLESMKYAQESENYNGIFRAYNGLGCMHIRSKDFEKAKEFLEKSLVVNEMTPAQKAKSLCDLGVFYIETGVFDKAEQVIKESYNIRQRENLTAASTTNLMELGRLYIQSGNYPRAIACLEEALETTIKNNARSKQVDCYYYLAQAFKATGQSDKAIETFMKYDKLQREFQSVTLQNVYQLKNLKIRKQKEVIESALNEIKSSIGYAQRIQNAILPSKEFIKTHLPESFVMYRPKDIVAGDFYWMEPIVSENPNETRKSETVLFAAADCTGHGVPGAMVSVVCYNALNRAVREFGLTDPADILNKVNELVQLSLSKNEDSDVKDGMDIALVALDFQGLQDLGSLSAAPASNPVRVRYAGANNSLYVISMVKNEQLDVYRSKKPIEHNGAELFEIKGTKQPIGKFSNSVSFESHTIELHPGDQLFLSTDGFPDQFGEERNKKLMYRPFKHLLLSIYTENLATQRTKLEDFFDSWKGSLEQTDDVCIIGVRL